MVSCVRDRTPSLRNTLPRLFSTVLGLRNSSLAMSRLLKPRAANIATSSSRSPNTTVGLIDAVVSVCWHSARQRAAHTRFDGLPPQTVTMAGLAATSALALANEGALIFPSAGGIIKRSSVGNPSYTFTYQLKSA